MSILSTMQIGRSDLEEDIGRSLTAARKGDRSAYDVGHVVVGWKGGDMMASCSQICRLLCDTHRQPG